MSKWLITGASGLLGSRMCENLALHSKEEILGIVNTHELYLNKVKSFQLDLTDTELVNDLFQKYKPDVTIHCAAITNVDYCEVNADEAYRINTEVSDNLARICANNNSKFVFISTDQLWNNHPPWISETDPVSPVNVYGKTKAEAEKSVLRYENSLVIRTNFFGKGHGWRPSLLEQIVDTLRDNNIFNGFKDIYFSPIEICFLADIIISAVNSSLFGIYHLAGCERLSKYDFALRVAEHFGLDKSLINKSSVKDMNFAAMRPSEMSLDTSKISNALGIKMPDINTSLIRASSLN